MCILNTTTVNFAGRVLCTLTKIEMDTISHCWINALSPVAAAIELGIDPKLVELGYAVCEYFSDCTLDEMSAMSAAAANAQTEPMPLTPVIRRGVRVRDELIELRAVLTD
jgi:hypothetical protein